MPAILNMEKQGQPTGERQTERNYPLSFKCPVRGTSRHARGQKYQGKWNPSKSSHRQTNAVFHRKIGQRGRLSSAGIQFKASEHERENVVPSFEDEIA